jgi:hypothetical protein
MQIRVPSLLPPELLFELTLVVACTFVVVAVAAYLGARLAGRLGEDPLVRRVDQRVFGDNGAGRLP